VTTRTRARAAETPTIEADNEKRVVEALIFVADEPVTLDQMAQVLGHRKPEELQALIKDVASTVDPFKRAQKAADLFGARAGPKLAQALADSGGDLDAFGIKMDDAKDATTDAEHIAWARRTAAVLADRSTSGGGYLNYGAPDEPIERVRAAYGDANFERLRQVKRRYDPHNLFRFNHNIPPAEA